MGIHRSDGRPTDSLRPLSIEVGYLSFAEGSALITLGKTAVLCAVSVEDRQPPFLRGTTKGWVTAEYAMLPRATQQRTQRESVAGRIGGRTHEIQRLIGRSLRAVVDLNRLGERTFAIDCDVLQADGGTRTAAITGGYVALALACERLTRRGAVARNPVHGRIAAVSVGIVRGAPVLDLDYAEDSEAETDMNIVMNDGGAFVEIQGTAEGHAFRRHELEALLDLAASGVERLFVLQSEALASGLGTALR